MIGDSQVAPVSRGTDIDDQLAIALLSSTADDLDTAMGRIRLLAYAICDTLIPIDRVAEQKPCYSGKHKRHGVNVQVITDAVGWLVGITGVARFGTRPDRRP